MSVSVFAAFASSEDFAQTAALRRGAACVFNWKENTAVAVAAYDSLLFHVLKQAHTIGFLYLTERFM